MFMISLSLLLGVRRLLRGRLLGGLLQGQVGTDGELVVKGKGRLEIVIMVLIRLSWIGGGVLDGGWRGTPRR